MKTRIFAAALCTMLIFLCSGARLLAHCDGLDGPVVQAAERALETGDVDLVLIWVQSSDEAELRRAFVQTLAVRQLNPEAKALADRAFFETLVRLHRAAEGASFTGLKPAGRDLGPIIPAADKALHDGSPDQLIRMLVAGVDLRVRHLYDDAVAKQKFAKDDIAAGRAFVKAYVEYIHAVEALFETASGPVAGHYDDTKSAKSHHD